jgi:hypothetical protein
MWKLSNKIRVIVVAQNSLPMILIEVEFDDNAFINGFKCFLNHNQLSLFCANEWCPPFHHIFYIIIYFMKG